jgi:hypothetical protein
MLRDHILVSLAGSHFTESLDDSASPERLVRRANALVDEACRQWGHVWARSGEIIVEPQYCARCGKSGVAVGEEWAMQRLKENTAP